jgi:hypothetical protein
MRKVYRPICAGSCEKKFIGNEARVPEGWYEGAKEALEAWALPKPAESELPTPEEPKRGPGRPPKTV